jgi:hypothetical protein
LTADTGSTREVRGADGTALRATCSDGTGIPVLLCNGLGAPPAAWPRIIAPDRHSARVREIVGAAPEGHQDDVVLVNGPGGQWP